MQIIFKNINKNIFKKITPQTLCKIFYIEADDIIFFTTFTRKKDDLFISIELYGWSNKMQKNVPIDYSVFRTDFQGSVDFGELVAKYSIIVRSLLDYLSGFKFFWQYKELFYYFENPNIVYSYKLINTFSKEELQFLSNHFDFSEPILNTKLFPLKNKKLHFHQLFLPHYISGCYFCKEQIEISTDLNNDDFAVIENYEGKITKEQLFNILKR